MGHDRQIVTNLRDRLDRSIECTLDLGVELEIAHCRMRGKIHPKDNMIINPGEVDVAMLVQTASKLLREYNSGGQLDSEHMGELSIALAKSHKPRMSCARK